jgi:hypothetical protein
MLMFIAILLCLLALIVVPMVIGMLFRLAPLILMIAGAIYLLHAL